MVLTNTKFFLPIVLGFSILSYFVFESAPAYTRWAIIFLIMPSIFFLFRRENELDHKKIFVVSLLAITMGLIWDHTAINLKIWDFPRENVSGWFLGIPIEEYIFAVGFPIIVIGIYTSLPKFRNHIYDGPRLKELPLLGLIFPAQMIIWLLIFFSSAQSYIKWLFLLAILPSFFYLWRKGEKIDEMRMLGTAAIIATAALVTDIIFINSGSWFHYDNALIGRITIVPIDDILFIVFSGISVIGLYTSLPKSIY